MSFFFSFLSFYSLPPHPPPLLRLLSAGPSAASASSPPPARFLCWLARTAELIPRSPSVDSASKREKDKTSSSHRCLKTRSSFCLNPAACHHRELLARPAPGVSCLCARSCLRNRTANMKRKRVSSPLTNLQWLMRVVCV